MGVVDSIRWQSACQIMTIVGSTGSRFVCYELMIEMVEESTKQMTYLNSEQVYEQRLKPVTNVYEPVDSTTVII